MINITSKYALDPGKKDSKLLEEEEEEEEETKNYRKISKKNKKKPDESTSCGGEQRRKERQQAWSATSNSSGIMEGGRGRRKLNAVAVIFCGPWLNVGGARVVVVGKSEVSQFRGDRGVGRRGVRG